MVCCGAVLAAGEGTRLHPLTTVWPKPLVPLGAGRLIDWALAALAAIAARPVVVNAWHLARQVAPALAATHPGVGVVEEAALGGTGGGVRALAAVLAASGAPPSTLVVINGDALFDFALAPALALHRARGAQGTLVLRRVAADSPFARVGVDAVGRVVRIAEVEGPRARHEVARAAFCGVQFMEPPLVARLPVVGPCDVLRTAWRDALADGDALFGAFVDDTSFWSDVGTPEAYLEAHLALLAGRLAAPGAPAADGRGWRVAPDARVEGVLVGPVAALSGAHVERGALLGPGVWLGAGARVAAGARVREAVVWPGAVVRGDVARAVVLTDGRVVPVG